MLELYNDKLLDLFAKPGAAQDVSDVILILHARTVFVYSQYLYENLEFVSRVRILQCMWF